MIVTRSSFAVALATILWLAHPAGVTASDELNRAKELYRSAAYDEALTVLDTIPVADTPDADTIEVHEYRVFCLVALDRREDARKAMSELVTTSPTYAMSEAEASPRVRTMFSEVRRALLPEIVRRSYADAKAAFDRKDPNAYTQFESVLNLLKDPDVASSPGLSDLATVAAGFRDLSKALAPVAPPAPPVVAEAPRAATPAPPVVVPPVVIGQPIPVPQLSEQREWDGEIEVTINDRGRVIGTRMTRPIHPVYDAQLQRAALAWTYRPALRDGAPIQFVKQISIHVDTRPPCSEQRVDGCRPSLNTR
jgi:hypothetical protein